MNQTLVRTGFSALLLALALALFVGGCIFGGDETTDTTLPVAPVDTAPPADVTHETSFVALDELSTFQSKDPFKQQALPPSTTTPSAGGSTTSTTGGGSTTSTTGGTTTTTKPSGVNNALHSLKVLSIDVVNGIPVVTFEVDDTVYEDKREGDVVSTTWGQIEVVSIDAEEQTVVFLHGSETRTLMVGQEFLK
jgi:hypothetical protein